MTDVGAGVGAGGAEPARVDFRCDDPEVDPYRLLTATVVPRPIAWVGTVGADGAGNLAPHSFYSVACAKPPIVSFTSVGHKDTLRNVRATGEFVVNLATADLVRAVNDTSAPFDPEIDEAGATGLTLVPSTTVSVPRVARSPVALECTLHSLHELGDSVLVLGDVRLVSVHASALVDGHPSMAALRPLSRLGSDEWGWPPEVFHLSRPRSAEDTGTHAPRPTAPASARPDEEDGS